MKLLASSFLLLGLVIFAFSFVYNYSWLSRPNPFFPPRPKTTSVIDPNFDYWVYPGDSGLSFNKKRSTDYKSINGMSRLSNLRVDVVVLGLIGAATKESMPFRTYENVGVKSSKPNDVWGDTISTKGSPTIMTMNSSIEIEIKSMPNDEDLWGRNAKVVITASYEYPTTTGSPTGYGDKKFTEITTPEFREEIPFRFATRAEKDNYETAREQYEQEQKQVDLFNKRVGWFYFISRSIGFILSLGLIGASIWLFIRAKRQKLKTFNF